MKAVVQRVSKALVEVEHKTVANIGNGLLVLIGIKRDDGEVQRDWLVNKIMNLRVFDDENGVMNRSVLDVRGGVIFVPNFTLYADTRKGFRPSYVNAAPSDISTPLFADLVEYCKEHYSDNCDIQSGIFGADMDVNMVNDGPVTLLIEKE